MPEPSDLQYPTAIPSGQVKIEICRRLGDDWRELANFFEIPPHVQRRFEQGWEGQAVWAWLEDRTRLSELPNGLRFIQRGDLADLLKQHHQASAERYYQGCIERWSGTRPRATFTATSGHSTSF